MPENIMKRGEVQKERKHWKKVEIKDETDKKDA